MLIEEKLYERILQKLSALEKLRPFNKGALLNLQESFRISMTYNSNAIEGNTLTKKDTSNVIFENITLKNKTLNEHLEAINHDKAFRFLLSYLKEKKHISEKLILELHKILTAGILDNAGSYRYHSVRIVGSNVPTANYLKIPELMKRLLVKKIITVEDTAYFHAEFEKIHPFIDGNGRIGRMIMNWQRLKNGLPLLIIRESEKHEYYRWFE